MKTVSFQSSIHFVSLSFLPFFIISDLTYSTVFFYEVCKFSNADILDSCVRLSYLTFYNLTYSIVICYEGCKFPDINKMVSCVLLSYISFFMISYLTHFSVICYGSL